MREKEEERCVRGHEEYRESEGKKGVGPFTNCDKEKDRAGEKESCKRRNPQRVCGKYWLV